MEATGKFSMIYAGVLLINCLLQQAEASSMEDTPVMHGFSHEKPLTLSPSAVDFFSPDVINFSPSLPPKNQIYQQHYHYSSASSSSEKNGDNMSGGAKAGIVLGVVLFGVVFAGLGTYVCVTRRNNMKRANAIILAP